VDVVEFRRVIKDTLVTSIDRVFVGGVEKDMANYPDLVRIDISRSRFPQIPRDARLKALVLHEYLGIMRVDDLGYRISSRLYKSGALAVVAPSARKPDLFVVSPNCHSESERLRVFTRITILTDAIKKRDFSDTIIEYADRALNTCVEYM
jgi:hypothetical protein